MDDARHLESPEFTKRSDLFVGPHEAVNLAVDKTSACSYNVGIQEIRFAWDPKKARANLDKHGVAFEEARSVFYDEHAVEFYDDKHSEREDRFLILGLSSRLRLLLVCHCYREEEGVIRIISARKATAAESKHYRRM